MEIVLGQTKYGDIVIAYVDDDRVITDLLGHDFVHRDSSYDGECYLPVCSSGRFTVGDVEYKNGDTIPEDFVPTWENEEIAEIMESGDWCVDNGYTTCESCGSFHHSDSEDFVVVETDGYCSVYCRDCIKSEDTIRELTCGADLFKARDIIGMAEPEGFTEVDCLFCDSSGWGSPSEPALTPEQAQHRTSELLKEHGTLYAGITGKGQFQVYVTLYSKD